MGDPRRLTLRGRPVVFEVSDHWRGPTALIARGPVANACEALTDGQTVRLGISPGGSLRHKVITLDTTLLEARWWDK